MLNCLKITIIVYEKYTHTDIFACACTQNPFVSSQSIEYNRPSTYVQLPGGNVSQLIMDIQIYIHFLYEFISLYKRGRQIKYCCYIGILVSKTFCIYLFLVSFCGKSGYNDFLKVSDGVGRRNA